jgi:transposase
VIDPSAVQAALEKLKNDPEAEGLFVRTTEGKRPAYNVQTAVDAECGLIVAREVTTETNDTCSLLPMAEAANQAVGDSEALQVVAGGGCGLLERRAGARCEVGVNHAGDGTLFDRSESSYDEASDRMKSPVTGSIAGGESPRRMRAVVR